MQKGFRIVIVVVILLIIKVVAVMFFNSRNESGNSDHLSRMGKTPEEMLSNIEKEAESRAPGVLKSEAMYDISKRNLRELVSMQGTDVKKRKVALAAFKGYHFKSGELTKSFCEKLGVDISPFVVEFDALHADELNLLKTFVSKESQYIDKELVKMRSSLEKILEQEMKDAASILKATELDVCVLLRDNPELMAEEVSFKKVNPDMHQIIHDD